MKPKTCRSDVSKRGGHSKGKGAGFERSICRKLSLWVSEGARDDVFWRSAMSGGRATIGLQHGSKRGAQAGDLSAIHPLGYPLVKYFFVECKFYTALNAQQVIFGKAGLLGRIWRKTQKQAKDHGKRPLAILKQSYQVEIVCVDAATLAWMRERLYPGERLAARIIVPALDLRILGLADMIAAVDPKRF